MCCPIHAPPPTFSAYLRSIGPFYNSCPWAKSLSRDENLREEVGVRGRHTVLPRAGAGQQFALGAAPRRPLLRPTVGSTQESLSYKQAPRCPSSDVYLAILYNLGRAEQRHTCA